MRHLLWAALCLAVAALFIRQERERHYGSAVILKGLASLCFVIFGVLGSAAAQDAGLARLTVAGLVLGCVADVLLNLRFVLEKAGQKIFLVGILVFLSGHVLYLAAVLPRCVQPLVCILAGVALTAIVMKWIFTKITAKKAFKIFGVFYIGAIVILNCVAFGNLIAAPGAWSAVFFAGALLFFVSDVVLILNTFGPEQKFRFRALNIGLYYVGQLLIAISLQFI